MGRTSLLLACEGGQFRTIQTLMKAGSKVSATSRQGNCALHFASSSCEADVVKFLVAYMMKRKSEAVQKEEIGSPESKMSFETLLRSLVDVMNLNGESVLHFNAMNWWKDTSLDLSQFFLKNKNYCPSVQDGKGYTLPSSLAWGEVRQVMRNIEFQQQISKLGSLETSVVLPLALCVFGSSDAGKKELLKVLKQKSSALSSEKLDPIILSPSKDSAKSPWTFCEIEDENSHLEMSSISFSMLDLLLLILDTADDYEVLCEKADKWLSIAKGVVFPPSGLSENIPILLVGNTKEAPQVNEKFSRVVQALRRKVSRPFIISEKFFLLNCRDPSIKDKELAELINYIQSQSILITSKKDFPVPVALKAAVEEIVSREDEFPMTFSNFTKELYYALDLSESDSELVIEFVRRMGLIVQADGHYILKPSWLYRKVIHPLRLAATKFPEGKAFAEEIRQLMPTDLEFPMEVLQSLDICHKVDENIGTYRFPAFISGSRPPKVWIVENSCKIHCGRRIQCINREDKLNPNVFPAFQNQVCEVIDKKAVLWKCGLKAVKTEGESFVEGLVELKGDGNFIDIIVRGREYGERACWFFLRDLRDRLMSVLDEKSPGTVLTKMYLSRADIDDLVETPSAYDAKDVQKLINPYPQDNDYDVQTRNRYGGIIEDTVSSLLVFPYGHINRLSIDGYKKLVSFLAEDRLWASVGEKLGISIQVLQTMKAYSESPGEAATKMLSKWGKSLLAYQYKIADILKELDRIDIINECDLNAF